jgi:hypothetical protein
MLIPGWPHLSVCLSVGANKRVVITVLGWLGDVVVVIDDYSDGHCLCAKEKTRRLGSCSVLNPSSIEDLYYHHSLSWKC